MRSVRGVRGREGLWGRERPSVCRMQRWREGVGSVNKNPFFVFFGGEWRAVLESKSETFRGSVMITAT